MRWGLRTSGLTYQISGQSQGSRRNIVAMPHSVSPRCTVYDLGAVGRSSGPAYACGAALVSVASAGERASAASIDVCCLSCAAAAGVGSIAGGGDAALPGWNSEQPVALQRISNPP